VRFALRWCIGSVWKLSFIAFPGLAGVFPSKWFFGGLQQQNTTHLAPPTAFYLCPTSGCLSQARSPRKSIGLLATATKLETISERGVAKRTLGHFTSKLMGLLQLNTSN